MTFSEGSPSRPFHGMRVAIVSRAVSFGEGIGGLERAVSDQAVGLSQLGWDVTLVTASHMDDTPNRIASKIVPWPLRRRGRGLGFGLEYWWWTKRVQKWLIVNASQYDAVYFHGASVGALNGLKRFVGNPRIVANPHGMEEFRPAGPLRWTNRVFIRHLARAASLADKVLATDERLVSDVLMNLRVPESQVTVIPNAVDVGRLDRVAAVPRRDNPGVTRVVSIGRIVPNKGYDMLLSALSQIASRRQIGIEWIHFGSGEQRAALEAQARGVSGLALTIIGGASDAEVQGTLKTADLFVQPSRYEGSSLTTLEAMTHGVVCVATPVGGIPDKIEEGVSGYLASEVSAQSLAEAIERALGGGRSTGSAARETVLRKFSLESTVHQISRLLIPTSAPSTPRPILQVARHIGRGSGVAQVVYSLEEAFARINVPTRRLTISNTGLNLRTKISPNPVQKLLLLVEVVWFSVAGTWALRRVRSRYPDWAIIVHGDPIGGDLYVNHGLLKAVVKARAKGRKLYLPANPMHWFTLLRDELRYSERKQRAIVCLTEEDRDTLQELYPRNQSPVYVISNGIDLDRYQPPTSEQRDSERAALGISSEEKMLLFIGHEFERKGLYIALNALRELSPHFTFLIVGGDTRMIQSAQEHAASALADTHRVIFVGTQSDPRPYYAASDIFVLPTMYETGPLVLLEALASGLPCVTTSTGLAPKLISEPLSGMLTPRTPEGVARGIREIEQRLDSDRKAVAKACVAAVEPYSWPNIAQRYVDLLDTVRPST